MNAIFAPVVDVRVVVGHEGTALTEDIALSSTPASAAVDDAEDSK